MLVTAGLTVGGFRTLDRLTGVVAVSVKAA